MKIGDKVVCIQSTIGCACREPNGYKIGEVYVVSGTSVKLGGVLFITLLGHHFPENWCHEADWVTASDFRLLDELKQEAKKRNRNVQVVSSE